MGVQKDAGELLAFIYKELVEDENSAIYGGISSSTIEKETTWNKHRIDLAFNYLNDFGVFKANEYVGGNFVIVRLYPKGINIIENQPEFKRNFGFSIGIPSLFQFSWGATEQ